MDVLTGAGLEAVSWGLASELMRRHPLGTRFFRGHPAGGQSDVLWIVDADGRGGDIRLNRAGRIHVLGRFDAGEFIAWEAVEWEDYLRQDRREFITRLEVAAGLGVPLRAPAATPITLTYRVLAAIAARTASVGRSIEIQEGYIDTSGYGGGPNRILATFPIPDEYLRTRDDDFWGQPGYRFWIAVRDDWPIIAIEQTAAVAWLTGKEQPVDLMRLYRHSHRNAATVASKLLTQVVQF